MAHSLSIRTDCLLSENRASHSQVVIPSHLHLPWHAKPSISPPCMPGRIELTLPSKVALTNGLLLYKSIGSFLDVEICLATIHLLTSVRVELLV